MPVTVQSTVILEGRLDDMPNLVRTRLPSRLPYGSAHSPVSFFFPSWPVQSISERGSEEALRCVCPSPVQIDLLISTRPCASGSIAFNYHLFFIFAFLISIFPSHPWFQSFFPCLLLSPGILCPAATRRPYQLYQKGEIIRYF